MLNHCCGTCWDDLIHIRIPYTRFFFFVTRDRVMWIYHYAVWESLLLVWCVFVCFQTEFSISCHLLIRPNVVISRYFLTVPSMTDWPLTFEPLTCLLLGPADTRTLHSMSLSHAITCPLMCDFVTDLWWIFRDFCCFFSILFLLPDFCMDNKLSWQSLPGKISKGTTIIFISLSSKCKNNA